MIEVVAGRAGISPCAITLGFGYCADRGGWEWTAAIVVVDPARKAARGASLRRSFHGAGDDPASALADAEEGFRRWKDPSIAEGERKRAMLVEIAATDPALAESLKKKGLI